VRNSYSTNPPVPACLPHLLILPHHFHSLPLPSHQLILSPLYIAIKGLSFALKHFLCESICYRWLHSSYHFTPHMRSLSPTPLRSLIACSRRVVCRPDANPRPTDAKGSNQGQGQYGICLPHASEPCVKEEPFEVPSDHTAGNNTSLVSCGLASVKIRGG
jgi:hypothetical protein